MFVIQILKLEMQAVDFLTRLGSLGLGLTGGETDVPVQSFQMRHGCEKEFLLLGDFSLRFC